MFSNLLKHFMPIKKTQFHHYKPSLHFEDIKTPHAILGLSDEIKEKIVNKYLKTYHSLSFSKLSGREEEKKLREVNYNAFEIGVLLEFVKHHRKIHATLIETEMFLKYFYNISKEHLEDNILSIANRYMEKDYYFLAEHKLKERVDWTPEDAAFLLYYACSY